MSQRPETPSTEINGNEIVKKLVVENAPHLLALRGTPQGSARVKDFAGYLAKTLSALNINGEVCIELPETHIDLPEDDDGASELVTENFFEYPAAATAIVGLIEECLDQYITANVTANTIIDAEVRANVSSLLQKDGTPNQKSVYQFADQLTESLTAINAERDLIVGETQEYDEGEAHQPGEKIEGFFNTYKGHGLVIALVRQTLARCLEKRKAIMTESPGSAATEKDGKDLPMAKLANGESEKDPDTVIGRVIFCGRFFIHVQVGSIRFNIACNQRQQTEKGIRHGRSITIIPQKTRDRDRTVLRSAGLAQTTSAEA